MTPEEKLCSRFWRLRNSAGILWSVLSFGILTGVNFLIRGTKSKNRLWVLTGIGFLILGMVVFIVSGIVNTGTKENPSTSVASTIWGWVSVGTFIGGVTASIITNKKWLLWKAYADDTKWYAKAGVAQNSTATPRHYGVATDAAASALATPYGAAAALPQTVLSVPAQNRVTSPSTQIDVNSASGQDLAAALGIDVATADRIVGARANNGPFVSFEQLISTAQVPPHLLIPHRGTLTFGATQDAPTPSRREPGTASKNSARKLDI